MLPKKLHPEHKDDKIYTSYDTPYHQDPLPPPLPLSLLNTTSYYYPKTKSNTELTENSSEASVIGIFPPRIGNMYVSAILSETLTPKLSESQLSENLSACEPQTSVMNNTRKFQCKQCKLPKYAVTPFTHGELQIADWFCHREGSYKYKYG